MAQLTARITLQRLAPRVSASSSDIFWAGPARPAQCPCISIPDARLPPDGLVNILLLQLQPPLYLQLALSTGSALPNCVPVDDTGEG